MRVRELIYDAALQGAVPIARTLARIHPKGAAAFKGREQSAHTFAEWGRTGRDRTRPLVLLHAPSVGEALMAQAIIHELRRIRPDAQIAFTFFSPSAERVVARVGADVAGYLPFDTRPAMKAFVADIAPSAVGFVRTEIWPTLMSVARVAGAHSTLLNAALGENSSRLRGGACFMLGPAYRELQSIGAVAAEDGARFSRLGVAPDRVYITGDARFDQVWQRVQSINAASPVLSLLQGTRDVIVAGSTWPADEAHVMDAFAEGGMSTRARLIIAPHEPTTEHVSGIERRAARRNLSVERLSSAETRGAPSADVIVVDRVGVLADLYAAATIAYVGGGFGTDGLHSVVEPAALGVPVIYGPTHGNAREAGDLAHAGGGFIVTSARTLASTINTLLDDATARELAGMSARTFVESKLGGAAANAALLAGLL